MIRADDRLALGALPAREQLVAAVPAAVRERSQHAVVAADQQHAARPGGFGPLIARFGQLVAPRHAQPAAAEEVPLLPGEHVRVHVRVPGQHPAFPERPERRLQLGPVQRSRSERHTNALTDHTVKTRCAISPRPTPASQPAGPLNRSLRITGRAADTAPMGDRNVLGGELEPCGTDPLTGFYRDGCCTTGPEDLGSHTICRSADTAPMGDRNVLGGELEPCGTDPLTGFYRDGCCTTGPEDLGSHTIC